MAVTPLADVRPAPAVLAQHLVSCPACGAAAAAHVDFSTQPATLVRFVCGQGCSVDAAGTAAVLAAVSVEQPCAGRPAPAA